MFAININLPGGDHLTGIIILEKKDCETRHAVGAAHLKVLPWVQEAEPARRAHEMRMMLSWEEPAVFGFPQIAKGGAGRGRRSGYHFFMANPLARLRRGEKTATDSFLSRPGDA